MVRTLLKSINSKIIALSLVLSLAALITVSVISFIAADNLLEERIKDQLLTESMGRGEEIRSLIDARTQQIQLLATNNVILNLVSQLSQNHTSIAGKSIENFQTEFQNEIESFRKVLGSSATLENVKVIYADGKVLLSTDPSEKGKDYSDSQKFKRGSIEPFLDFDLVNNKRVVVVTVPIIENMDDNKTSSHNGVVMATMDTRTFDQVLLNRQGLGQTGEVYMANENKKMISESRFIKNAAFHITVDTLPVRQCFDRGINIGTFYNDYRNIPIFGFSYCAKDLGFVLHAKIDEAEIFQPITDLRNKIIGTSIGISGIVIALAFYVSRTISRPIIQLRKAADRISEGEYDYRANDITELNYEYELQEALKRDRKSAEIIKRQLEELQKTNLELRQQDKLKDEFFSMISHELKTPLTPIIGWCGALKDSRILGNITSEQRAAVDTIESNAVMLEKMISDMLDVQKLELNEMKFNIGDVNVDSIFNKIRKDFKFVMKKKNIQFIIKAEPNLRLKSDESRILQVFSALLYNSVDFVPQVGGKIELTAAESKSGDIEFTLSLTKQKQAFTDTVDNMML